MEDTSTVEKKTPPEVTTYRVYQIQIGALGFIAAAERHRSEGPDPDDHYRVAYKLVQDGEELYPVLEALEKSVKADEENKAGFVMKLAKRGMQSTVRLGKLILAHLMMDLSTARVLFSMESYDYFIGSNELLTTVDVLVGGYDYLDDEEKEEPEEPVIH